MGNNCVGQFQCNYCVTSGTFVEYSENKVISQLSKAIKTRYSFILLCPHLIKMSD